jgi:hypothetical protein
MLDTQSAAGETTSACHCCSEHTFHSFGVNSYSFGFPGVSVLHSFETSRRHKAHAAFETSQSLATPVTGAGRRKTLRLTALGWTARQTILQKTRIHEPIPSYLQRSHMRLNYRIPGEIIRDRRPDYSTRTRSIRVLEMTLDLCQKAKNTRWTT